MPAALFIALALVQAPRMDDGVGLAVDGEYAEALACFERLRRSEPASPVYNYYVGLCHLYLKDTPMARHYLGKSTEQKAAFPKAYYWLAQAWLADDGYKEAAGAVAQGLEKFPANVPLRELAREIDVVLKTEPR